MPDPAAPSATAILTLVAIALSGAAAAQGERSRNDDPVARGAYLATAAG